MKLKHMKRTQIIGCLLLLQTIVLSASADDLAVAKKLEQLGGKVTLSGDAVVAVMFRDSSKLGDAEWKMISELSSLTKLTTYGKAHGLNDDTVGLLANLTNLTVLSTDGAQLSDSGLEKLAAVKSLRSVSFFHLSFRKEGFTGKGFAAWSNLPNLEQLTVAGMSMGDEGFAAIAKISSLTELRTWHTHRTQVSNAEIAKLPNLTTLKLGQRLPRGKGLSPCLTDESLATLGTIRTLKMLEIGEARFSLKGLSQLKALPDLTRLKIDRSEVAAEEIDKLKTVLPKVEVQFEPITEEQRERLKSYLR
jgi:hypothetical protein